MAVERLDIQYYHHAVGNQRDVDSGGHISVSGGCKRRKQDIHDNWHNEQFAFCYRYQRI